MYDFVILTEIQSWLDAMFQRTGWTIECPARGRIERGTVSKPVEELAQRSPISQASPQSG